jgi:hypothetical protein
VLIFGCGVFNNFVIFHQIKVAKHIWEPCCHLAAETGPIALDVKGMCSLVQFGDPCKNVLCIRPFGHST